MDITAAALHSTLTAALAPAGVGASPASADALAAAQFSQLMGAQSAPASASAIDSPALQNNGVLAPNGPSGQAPTLGESILGGVSNLSEQFQQSWRSVHSALEGGQLMPAGDLLKLQMGLTQMAIQYELVGKAVGRSTQNIDQLVKMQ